jgi:manganese/zinc/iron transport system substrate-binding protein
MRRVFVITLLLSLLLLTACADQTGKTGAGDKVKAVATIGMISDIVQRIGGDRASVTGLMGPGVDPHLYKASEGDVTRMAEADIIFYNGLHLEGAMTEVLEQMNRRVATVAVTTRIEDSLLLSPAEFEGAHDPHVWFDVTLWMHAVEQITEALIALDSKGAETYRANANALTTELGQLHQYVLDEAAKVPESQRVLITAHDAFNYFGRAYGFEVRGLQGISTAAEAGTADVQELADFIADHRIPAIFVESSVPSRNIEAVQAAVASRGFDVSIGGELFSDAMGSAGTPEGTYIGMVRHNINTIVSALLGESEAETGQ